MSLATEMEAAVAELEQLLPELLAKQKRYIELQIAVAEMKQKMLALLGR